MVTYRDATLVPGNAVLTLSQLYLTGMSAGAVRQRIKNGLWQMPLPDVVLTRPGPLTTRQQREAALLWAGPDAALAGETAAAIDGLRGYPDDRVHVMAHTDSGLRSRDFAVVHRTLLLDARHVHPARRPRRARIERAVIDIATRARSWEDGIAVMAAAVQQRLTRTEDLRSILADFPRARWRYELLSVLGDLEGGSASLPEVQAIRAIRSGGLPVPDRQTVRMEGERRRYLDLWWDAWRLCLEIDGRLHLSTTTWWQDMLRDAEITIDQSNVVRIPAFIVRLKPEVFTDLVRRLLVSRGWVDPRSLAVN